MIQDTLSAVQSIISELLCLVLKSVNTYKQGNSLCSKWTDAEQAFFDIVSQSGQFVDNGQCGV